MPRLLQLQPHGPSNSFHDDDDEGANDDYDDTAYDDDYDDDKGANHDDDDNITSPLKISSSV